MTGSDLPPAPVQQNAAPSNVDMSAAIQAAMEAAQKISKVGRWFCAGWTVAPTPKPRTSRFSSSVLTKKMYFPQQYPDIAEMRTEEVQVPVPMVALIMGELKSVG